MKCCANTRLCPVKRLKSSSLSSLRRDNANKVQESLDTPSYGSTNSPTRVREYRNPLDVQMQRGMIVDVLQPSIMRRDEDKSDPKNPIITKLEKGDKIAFLAYGQNNRMKVKTNDGKEGWASIVNANGNQILAVKVAQKKSKTGPPEHPERGQVYPERAPEPSKRRPPDREPDPPIVLKALAESLLRIRKII